MQFGVDDLINQTDFFSSKYVSSRPKHTKIIHHPPKLLCTRNHHMLCLWNGAEQLLRRGDWLLVASSPLPPDPNARFRELIQLLEQHFPFRTAVRIVEGVLQNVQEPRALPVFEELEVLCVGGYEHQDCFI